MLEIKSIADGVRLVSIQTDRFKTANIQVSMALPLNSDAATNAVLLYLLKRSCKSYPDFTELQGKLDELYGAAIGAEVIKSGEAQVLSLNLTCIDDRFALNDESIVGNCANLLAGMIFAPNCKNGSFGTQAVDTEKRLLRQHVEEEVNNKRVFALNRCIELMCAEEAYGINRYGGAEAIDAVKVKDVYAAWKNLLKSALFQITVVSSSPAVEIERIFAEKFAKIEREPVEINTVFIPKGKRFKRHEEEFPVNQGRLIMGLRAGMTNWRDNLAAVTVMNNILGGSANSKLFKNIREKLSLCYDCSSRLIYRKGLVLIACGIDPDKEKKTSAEILCQLSDIREGKVSAEELEAGKMSLRERLTFNTPGELCAWYTPFVAGSDDEVISPEQMAASFDGVTVEDVAEAAKKLTLDTIYMITTKQKEESKVED